MSKRVRLAGAFAMGFLAFGSHGGGSRLYAQEVESPPIEVRVIEQDRSLLLEWNHPDPSRISRRVIVDSIWGGTAQFEIAGEFTGHCDMDINLRASEQIDTFSDPFVEQASFTRTDTTSFEYWSGSSTPMAGGKPDICEKHVFTIRALDSDTLKADGTASDRAVRLQWFEGASTDTIEILPTFEPEVDSIPIRLGVWVSFGEGTINGGDQFSVTAVSQDVQFAWDYIPHGGQETERLSSSDSGQTALTFCRPGQWVDFDLGLSFRFVADSAGNAFIPRSSDTLGVLTLLFRKIDGYRIYRSDLTNPENFVVLRELSFCDSADHSILLRNPVQYVDREGTHNGFPYVYYVTSFDTLTGQESPSTVRTAVKSPRSDPTEDLDKIAVVPNPYKRRAAWEEEDTKIQFTHLPERARIRIFTVGGDLVWEDSHDSGGGTYEWHMKNDHGDLVVSGVYIYHVESASRREKVGKFIIVR